MNTKIHFLTLALAIGVTSAFAQTSIKYSSPEPDAFKPLVVKTDDANREAQTVSGGCGYTKAFFTKDELVALMNISGCVGIRIYNSKETEGQTYCDVIAVAVDANGKEIGPAVGNKYLHAKSFDENTSCSSKKISKTKAEGCVKNVVSSKLNYQKVFFSKALVEDRFKASGSTGIAVLPGSTNGGSTMMIAAASLNGAKLTELESNYLKSQLPCPTDCGDTSNYLVAPN